MPATAAFQCTPQVLNMGNVVENTASVPQTVVVSNIGPTPINIYITPTDPRFVATPSGNQTIGVGGSLNVVFVFNATLVLGAANATYINFQGFMTPVRQMQLNATTVPSGGGGGQVWHTSPGSIDFGSLKLGTSSSVNNVTINNTGTTTLVIDSIVLDATFDFSLSGLPSFPANIAAGGNLVFGVTCNSSIRGPNDYNPGITITPSLGPPQTVELLYTGFSLVPAYTLTGLTQGVLFGLEGFVGTSFAGYIAQCQASLPCETGSGWTKQFDFDNAGANTYLSKVYLRNEPSGTCTAFMTDTTLISGQDPSVSTQTSQAGTYDSTGIVNWLQFDFEANGESHKLQFFMNANGGIIITSMIILQYELRGVVYETT